MKARIADLDDEDMKPMYDKILKDLARVKLLDQNTADKGPEMLLKIHSQLF